MRQSKLFNQMREGVSPSRVWLPKSDCVDVVEFLTSKFSQIPRSYWLQRVEDEQVLWADGQPVKHSLAYRTNSWLLYYREIPTEPPIPFNYTLLFEDDELIVIDKPHFLPTCPAGRYVRETALSRLKIQYNNPEISPLHRLDKDTAGVLLFSKRRQNRGAYQTLFASRQVNKTYLAVLKNAIFLPDQFVFESRLKKGDLFCIMQEAAGSVNTETRFVRLKSLACNRALYALYPKTGLQHQLRAHCAAVGSAIVNDRFYPILLEERTTESFEQPLQLLATEISFIDPYTNEARVFRSQKKLLMAESI